MNPLSISYRLALLVAGLLTLTLLAVTANPMGRLDGTPRVHALYAVPIEPFMELHAPKKMYGVQLPQRMRDDSDPGALAWLADQGRARWQAFARRSSPTPELAQARGHADQAQAKLSDRPGPTIAMQAAQSLSKVLATTVNRVRRFGAEDDATARRDYEGARAGEEGRGLAVVAGEVRSLTGRSAAAAREVPQLIADSHSRVEAGSQHTVLAGETMTTIADTIDRVGTLIGEISAGSLEQAKGLSDIGAAVARRDEVPQQYAALVEQSAGAAESLRGQAKSMMGLVARVDLHS